MKNTLLVALVCIGLGVAIGWIAKPSPEDTADNAPSSDSSVKPTPKPSSRPRPKATESDRDPALTSSVIGGEDGDSKITPEQRAAMEKGQNQWTNMLKKRQRAKVDARIAKLVSDLNLTPEQEAELRKKIEDQFGGLEGMFSGETDPSKMGDLAKLLGGDGVDEALNDLLTPEQKEAHEELKKRELANKVEAKALKNLAKLSFLDMSQEQKEAAYDILYSEAEESVAESSPEGAVISMMTSGLGIDIDVDDLGIAGAFSMENARPAEDGSRPDPAAMMAKANASMAKRVDEKVEALRPVLNETQLDAYRKNLESKSSGLFGGFLQSQEIEIPSKED